MQCRICYVQALTEDERARFVNEAVTQTIYYCPDHRAQVDEVLEKIGPTLRRGHHLAFREIPGTGMSEYKCISCSTIYHLSTAVPLPFRCTCGAYLLIGSNSGGARDHQPAPVVLTRQRHMRGLRRTVWNTIRRYSRA